ncbi:FkbM family methyltransferase [Gloeothece verrucosa]|uniref:Methyltransferase FkbM family n=1 Tax=Gloeothece verrucosa (strain PCC 7822) TaxID=497965 RepID=E0UAJ7_GLOV7|nr:FkbM family methyltransferase [Gloeothece verrucosa]ADN12738.1 methyltransferase FkbM family [Gloeothece verrucosa PCC 7822]
MYKPINRLKSIIKKSPLSPLAKKIYRNFSPHGKNELYDRQIVEVMRRCLKNDSVCVDIGAHTGTILKHMIDLAPNATHFAFEPIPHLANFLQTNFPQTRVYELALSDESKEVEFNLVTNDPAYSGLRKRNFLPEDAKIEKILVRTEKLDNIIPSNVSISFIKIDVEGAEYLAFQGGIETLKRNRPTIVFESGKKSAPYYNVTPEKIFNFLKNECELQVSTMKRWLENKHSFSKEEFCLSFNKTKDFVFMAYS